MTSSTSPTPDEVAAMVAKLRAEKKRVDKFMGSTAATSLCVEAADMLESLAATPVQQFAENLAAKQQPLGREFEPPADRFSMYESDTPVQPARELPAKALDEALALLRKFDPTRHDAGKLIREVATIGFNAAAVQPAREWIPAAVAILGDGFNLKFTVYGPFPDMQSAENYGRVRFGTWDKWGRAVSLEPMPEPPHE